MQYNELTYLAHYDVADSGEFRSYSPAAAAKIEYFLDVLEELQLPCRMISASRTYGEENVSHSETRIRDNIRLTKLSAMGRGGGLRNALSSGFFRLHLLCWLLTHVKRNAPVLAYHSSSLMRPLRILKRLKRIRLILDVEEIYGDVDQSEKASEKELRFFDLADAYLFSAALLGQKVNTEGKPAVVANGIYRSKEKLAEQAKDGKIHCIYAGTLDPRKGALTAVRAAAFLPKEYCIHILGFGSEEERKLLQNEIEALPKDGCRVTYDGCLQGEGFDRFLQTCHIGLSTQNAEAAYSATSFPSKILTYLANGLKVVSVDIPAVRTSGVSEAVAYYQGNDPELAAKAVMEAARSPKTDSRTLLTGLHEEFSRDLGVLLEKMGIGHEQ